MDLDYVGSWVLPYWGHNKTQFIFCKMSKWNIVLWTTCSGSQLGAKIESSTPNPLIRQREIFIVLFSNKKKMSRTIQEKKTTGGCFGATPIEQRACSLRDGSPYLVIWQQLYTVFKSYKPKPISTFRIDPSPKSRFRKYLYLGQHCSKDHCPKAHCSR